MKDPKAYIDFDTGINRYIVGCKLETERADRKGA